MMGSVRLLFFPLLHRLTERSAAALKTKSSVLALVACLQINPVQALEALDDIEMGEVTGQKGILLSMQYYFNSHPDLNGGPVTAGPSGCSTPNGGSSLADTDCRFALQITNREDEWLVFKNGYASLDVNRLALDASLLGDSKGAGAAYSTYFDADKFKDENGTCLLEGGCSTASISDMAGLRLSYPEGTNGANFGNVRFGMFFEGLAVEPNAGAPAHSGWANQSGWKGDQNGSFMGLNIADNNGHQARIAFGGDFYLYGF